MTSWYSLGRKFWEYLTKFNPNWNPQFSRIKCFTWISRKKFSRIRLRSNDFGMYFPYKTLFKPCISVKSKEKIVDEYYNYLKWFTFRLILLSFNTVQKKLTFKKKFSRKKFSQIACSWLISRKKFSRIRAKFAKMPSGENIFRENIFP